MKRKAEIFRNYAEGKTRTRAPLRLEKTRPFRFLCARDQREGSDVDILVEIEPEIGLRFVELANRIEDALGIGPEVVSRRAIKLRYWEIIQEELVDVPRTGEISPVFTSVNLPPLFHRLATDPLEDSDRFRSSNHVQVNCFESFQMFKMSGSF